MTEANIFSALGKYLTSEENYLTEAFVFLLNTLLARERALGVEILNKLCGANQLCFDGNEDISVSTQKITLQGTPDIKISCADKLVYVEVKYESDLGAKQVERYLEALKSSGIPTTCLVLLTKLSLEFGENETKPHKHVRWFEVHNWLGKLKAHDPVSEYLIDAFKSFLEVKGMSIQKVSWEYISGVPAFNYLLDMIEAAIKDANIPLFPGYPRSAAWERKGFWLGDKEFLCGVYYRSHLVLVFEWQNKKYDSKLLEKRSYELREEGEDIWFRLPLEDIHFFSLDKDKQLEEITKFVKTAYAEAEQMKVKP